MAPTSIMSSRLTVALSCVLVCLSAPLSAQWPQFRGPNGSGIGDGTGYPTEFSPTTNVAWKTAVPFGQSSPVIAANRLYLTGIEGGELLTIAIDAGTGKALWRRALRRERKMEMYKANDPASPTPAADERGVVSFFADFGLVAYGTDGRLLWSHQMGPFQNFYGLSASPIIADGLVLQLVDQLRGSYLVALDRETGQVRWKADRPSNTIGYATPTIFRPPEGPAEIVTIGTTRLDSYVLETGAPRWWTPVASGGSMGVVLAQGDTLFVSTTGSNEPVMPQWVSALGQYDTDKDGRISRAELLPDKELGEHFGWIDTNDDSFVTDAEWGVARALGQGAWGSVAMTPGAARGQLPGTAVPMARPEERALHPGAAALSRRVLPGEDRRHRDHARSGHRHAVERGPRHGRAGPGTTRRPSPLTAGCTSPISKERSRCSSRAASGKSWRRTTCRKKSAPRPPSPTAGSTCARVKRCTASSSRLSSRWHADRRESPHQEVGGSINLNRHTSAGSSRAGHRRGPPSWRRTPMLRLPRLVASRPDRSGP